MPNKLMPITAHVEEAAFGKVVNILHATKGVLKLDFHLEGTPKGKKGGKAPGGLKPASVILAALSAGPHTKPELESVLLEAGITPKPATVHGAVYQLKKKKLVTNGKVKNGRHAYQLTAAGKKSLAAAAKKE
jgi:hypothetical protein